VFLLFLFFNLFFAESSEKCNASVFFYYSSSFYLFSGRRLSSPQGPFMKEGVWLRGAKERRVRYRAIEIIDI
jgi:hypothetical protein